MDPSTHFSETDLEAIRQATQDAEGLTSGEIVPVVIGRCDDYDDAVWKSAALGAVIGALIAGLLHYFFGFWGGGVLWLTAPTISGAALAALLATFNNATRRMLVGAATLDLRVERRAHQAFLEEEVFSTRDRTGILIFMALFEHRVVVLGDEGINRAVEQKEWDEVVDHLVYGIRDGAPGPALVSAIGECGRLLKQHGVDIRPDDTDELRDGLRMEKR